MIKRGRGTIGRERYMSGNERERQRERHRDTEREITLKQK